MKESEILNEDKAKFQNEKQSLVDYEAKLRKREQQLNDLNSMVNRDKVDIEKDRVETLIAKRTLGAYEVMILFLSCLIFRMSWRQR